MSRNLFSKIWKILNGILAAVFLYLIVDAWVEVLYFRSTEKHYYYIGTLFIIPLLTCLIVVFGWNLDDRKG